MNAFDSFAFIYKQRQSIIIAHAMEKLWQSLPALTGIPSEILTGQFNDSYAASRQRYWWAK